MRLLLTTDSVGGVWTFTRELSEGLLRSGCDIALASVGPSPSHSQNAWVTRMQSAWGKRFQFSRVDAPLEWMQDNELAFDAAPALQAIAGCFEADLIHSGQYFAGALEIGLPVVLTAHSDVFSWAASCRAQPLGDTPWLRRYRTVVNAGLAKASAIVAPTRWMLDALAENFVLPATRQVIPNGRSAFPACGPTRTLQAVTCGRLWDEAKNVGLLGCIEAPMPLFVAGETAHQGAALLEQLGSALLLGPLSEAELLALLHRSAIYICTSTYEPFGLAALEAALCGCAVVANDIAPLREVWGDAALYFSDASSLSALLQQLAIDSHLLSDFQLRSATRAARYTPEAMTAAYLALYEECVRVREVSRAA